MAGENQFRSVFKYYKSKKPPPSFTEVIDLHNSDHWDLFREHDATASTATEHEEVQHTNKISQWRVGSYKAAPGLAVVRNVFSNTDQLYWASKCLKEYSSDTFKRNIDHPSLNLAVGDWWEECQEDASLVDKLRWSTLGYHHDWDTKVYREDNRSIFPPELASLSSQLATVLGYPGYRAEAAIVNFYPFSASLSGHTDKSEHNLSAPLISISLGQSAIFLLGGTTVQEVPVAFLVRSGDILVMEEGARLAFHAVPRIVPGPDVWGGEGFCSDYLALHRININIRQVH
eukprot:GFUD01025245.1.p1 GENE.GFUD01025245.1~~GFUD01025245.1.p1  ORF type:complete len:287 (+),score=92.85 GFUD01025245.1:203-1063(+)